MVRVADIFLEREATSVTNSNKGNYKSCTSLINFGKC